MTMVCYGNDAYGNKKWLDIKPEDGYVKDDNQFYENPQNMRKAWIMSIAQRLTIIPDAYVNGEDDDNMESEGE